MDYTTNLISFNAKFDKFACMQELLDFRGKCGTLWTYSWISIPLIYTQVTCILYNYNLSPR